MIHGLKEVKASEAKGYAVGIPRPGVRDKTGLIFALLSILE